MLLNEYKSILTGVVADFGCNTGYMTLIASQVLYGAEMVYGIDSNSAYSDEQMRLLIDNPAERSKLRFINQSIQDLDRPDNWFDNAFMFQVLEHMTDEEVDPVLSNLQRVIKPSGKMLITVPYDRAYDCSAHKRYFDLVGLQLMFEAAGWKVLECYRDERNDKNGETHNRINCMVENIK
jgi:SAM-dependent methyltransferase